MVDLVELFLHWDAGRPIAALAASLGMDRKTVRKYLRPALEAGMSPGQGLSAEAWRELLDEWFPQLKDSRLRQISWPQFDAQVDWIRGQVKANVTGATIHQRLRDEHGVQASVRSFQRWLQATLAEEVANARGKTGATVLKPPSAPGELAEVDYGSMGSWANPETGKKHRVWAFIMTLPCSKQPFVFVTTRMDQAVWSRAHVAAFEFFGGVPARIVLDNLKTGVIKPDLYDPRLNKAYAELGAHYGVLLDPARAAKPKDKPHVERMVQYVRGSFWAGREFSSLQQMQEEAERWAREVAGQRKSRALDGRRPADMLDQLERPALKPLPGRRLEIATWTTAKVGSDCHVAVKSVLYSLPYLLVGHRVDVRISERRIDFFRDGRLAKTHPRVSRGRQTDVADYPPAKARFLTRDASWCREQAASIGPAATELIGTLVASPLIHQLRCAQRIIRLTETFSEAAVESACAGAIACGDPTLKTVNGLLKAGVETPPELPSGDNGAGALLRGPAAFTTSTN